MCSFCTEEWYSAIERNAAQMHTTARASRDHSRPSEGSQTRKVTDRMTPLVSNIQNVRIHRQKVNSGFQSLGGGEIGEQLCFPNKGPFLHL